MSTGNNRFKELETKAATIGWKFERFTGTSHARFVHTSGAVYTGPRTPSDHRSVANTLAAMERMTGEKRQRVNKGKVSKSSKTMRNGYSDTFLPQSQIDWSNRIQELLDEYKSLVLEIKIIATTKDDATQTEKQIVLRNLRRINAIEDFLEELHYPIEKFNPLDLTA